MKNILRLLALPALLACMGLACSDPQGSSSSSGAKPVCIVGQNSVCLCPSGVTGTKQCLTSEGEFSECRFNGGTCPTGTPDAGPEDGPEEQCPGKPVGVGATAVTLTGTTVGARADLKGEASCASLEGNPDHIYKIVSSATGALKIEQTGTYKVSMYVRKGDCTGGKQLRCDPNTPSTFSVNVIAGKEYYLVLKAPTITATGEYSLHLQVTPGGFCGDGQVKDQEVCDDENNDASDGCASSCLEIDGVNESANTCPGQPVIIPVGKTVKVANGTTVGGASAFPSNSAAGCGLSAAANERVYAVTPRKSGTLHAKQLTGDFNLLIGGQKGCDPSAAYANCAYSCGAGSFPPACAEEMTMPVTANTTYAVVVDGQGASVATGTYSFELSVP